MIMYWLSIVLAIFIGGCTLVGITNGIGLQLIGLVLAGNAYVRLQRGKPPKTTLTSTAVIVALIVSGIGFAVGVFLLMR